MDTNADPSLSSLRWLLFFFFGGVGCLLPFLSLHARSVGLSLDEARLVTIISPLLAFIGPVVSGPLVDFFSSRRKVPTEVSGRDKNVCIRVALSSSILLATICYSLLLSVPYRSSSLPNIPLEPKVSFACSELGAILLQEHCKDLKECYQYPAEKFGAIRLKSCRFDCMAFNKDYFVQNGGDSLEVSEVKELPTTTIAALTTLADEIHKSAEVDLNDFFKTDEDDEEDDEDMIEWGSGREPESSWVRRRRESESERIPSPPHICYGSSSKRMCNVFTPYSVQVAVNTSLRHARNEGSFCLYPLGGNFICRIPSDLEKPKDSCQVVCDVEHPFADGSVLLESQCPLVGDDPANTFWLYLLYRSFGDLFTAVAISLLIGATITAVRLQIGREFLFPTVAYAIFACLGGYLQSSDLTPLLLDHIPPYFLSIVGFGLLSMCSVFILIFSTEMPIGAPDWWSSSRGIRMRHKAEFISILLVLTLLGVLWGPHFSHVPWQIEERLGLELYVGTSLGFGALLSLPFVWKADVVTDYCGYSNLLIAAFTFYILRYTGLLFIKSPWVLLMTGGMEVFTLSLMTFSAILYLRHLVPKHLTFTAQSLGFAAHFCLGNGLGCLAATLLSPTEEQLTSVFEASNATTLDELEEDDGGPYYMLYCVGAIFSAIVASVYFILYHCCLKKKCLAPPYRKPATSPPLVQGSTGNGTYTPLRVFHNGQQHRHD